MTEETSFLRLKKALLELKDGYPTHIFWGKIEYFQQLGPEVGKKVVKLLDRHGIIEKITPKELDELLVQITPDELAKMPPTRKERLESYRLTAKGVELTISMINLEYGERMESYAKETNHFTKIIVLLTKILATFGGITIILMVIQIIPALALTGILSSIIALLIIKLKMNSL